MKAIFRPKTGKKRVQDTASDSLSEMVDTSSKGYKDIIKVKDNQIRSLTSKLNIVKDEEDQDQGSILDQEPTWEDVKALAETQGIKGIYLEIPMVKKEVKKLIKGMTIEEIGKNVKQLKELAESKGIKLGVKTDDKPEDAVDELFKQNPGAFG